MISLPLQPSRPHTAKSLMQEIGATVAIELDSKRGVFRGFTASDPGPGFPIEGGVGYIVNVPQGKVVSFVGRAWRNTPPVQSAPPNWEGEASAEPVSAGAWAFILSAKVEGVRDTTLTVRNPRTGVIEPMSYTDTPDNLHTIWADLSRRPVVQVGDVLEIQVRDGGQQLIGVLHHEVTSGDIHQAFAQLRLTPLDLRPTRTMLYANYPNPFNPETWMPYQLAEDTTVSIQIYDAGGRSVRTLNLGHQVAGYYLEQSRAAYWDGRNETGEKMASGIYFYQLVAGQSVEVRKLVIIK
jgi:hypothetical protein